jgi:DNA-binding transcriptional regulator YhcF (GntR family)
VSGPQRRGIAKRTRIVEIVEEHWQKAERAPTIRELAAELGASIAATHRHVEILHRLGLIEYQVGTTSRRIRPRLH